MEVLLNEDIKTLGLVGDVVKVKAGYARNYLFPKNLAVIPTPQALEQIAAKRKRVEAERIKVREEATAAAKKLEGASVTLEVKVGENDQLYGAISSSMVADQLKAETGSVIPADQIVIAETIKELGTFVVDIKLHSDVTVPLKVWVVKSDN